MSWELLLKPTARCYPLGVWLSWSGAHPSPTPSHSVKLLDDSNTQSGENLRFKRGAVWASRLEPRGWPWCTGELQAHGVGRRKVEDRARNETSDWLSASHPGQLEKKV